MNSFESANRNKIWGLAAAAGVVAFLALKIFASYSFMPALLLAVLIGVLVAILLWVGYFRDAESDDSGSAAADNEENAAKAKVVTPANAGNDAVKPVPAAARSAKKPSAKAKKTTVKSKTVTKDVKKTAEAVPETRTASAAADTGAAKAGPKKTEGANPARKPVSKSGKPPVIRKARATGADDLKLIKGVGPALEKTLNELGFYHFDQIAGWRQKEIEWVDQRLKFKGRIERDGWIKQCQSLTTSDTKKPRKNTARKAT